MKPISVLIVDDSSVIRALLSEILSGVEDISVVDTATDALDAREKIKKHNPDVLTLDIEMPKMDGLSFLEKIMALRPMPVIMISTLTQKGAHETIRALELGAVDYIGKPLGDDAGHGLRMLKDELVTKIRVAAQARIRKLPTRGQCDVPTPLSFKAPEHKQCGLIAMGSSTGGVEALRDIFKLLPAGLPPIVMVQHMPRQFTGSLAARLNSISKVEVMEAVHGTRLENGHAYLAPGDQHMEISGSDPNYTCRLREGEQVSGHRPSVDVLFRSVAAAAGGKALGIILTGMGKDGSVGLLDMLRAGAYNIGQSEASCVVYGMPKAAKAAGAVHREFKLSEIAEEIVSHCELEKGASRG